MILKDMMMILGGVKKNNSLLNSLPFQGKEAHN
jgi:hypothetical protein